jgi:hypothetical protein
MKKSIIFSILLIILSAFLSGCNESNIDTKKDGKFTRFNISLKELGEIQLM